MRMGKIPSNMKTKLNVVAVAVMTGVALGSLTGLSSCQRQQESALKPIDKASLQTLVDTTARELLIPGAVVLLCTPKASSRSATASRYQALQFSFTIEEDLIELGWPRKAVSSSKGTSPDVDTHFAGWQMVRCR